MSKSVSAIDLSKFIGTWVGYGISSFKLPIQGSKSVPNQFNSFQLDLKTPLPNELEDFYVEGQQIWGIIDDNVEAKNIFRGIGYLKVARRVPKTNKFLPQFNGDFLQAGEIFHQESGYILQHVQNKQDQSLVYDKVTSIPRGQSIYAQGQITQKQLLSSNGQISLQNSDPFIEFSTELSQDTKKWNKNGYITSSSSFQGKVEQSTYVFNIKPLKENELIYDEWMRFEINNQGSLHRNIAKLKKVDDKLNGFFEQLDLSKISLN